MAGVVRILGKAVAVLVPVSLYVFGPVPSFAPSAQGTIDPISWALAVEPSGATSKPGGTISLALTATVDEGWHLYAMKLEPGGPVATSITIPEGQIFTSAGEIGEPMPLASFDGNFNKVLEYHEGKAVFTVPVKSAATAPVGKQTVRVTASYQTCNDRLCLPARQVVVTTDVQLVSRSVAKRNMMPSRWLPPTPA